MLSQDKRESGEFGRLLRFWRAKRKLSQLELAALAETTPRHISFIETGRSRPGRELILRIARVLDLSVRDVNGLMVRAGLPPEYAEHDFDDSALEVYREAIEAILAKHEPFPACAIDSIGNVLLANDAFWAFTPIDPSLSREEAIDGFFDPAGPMASFVENWDVVVWNWVDRQDAALALTNNPELEALVSRARTLLSDTPRPQGAVGSDVLTTRFTAGGRTISTFATVMRFESAAEVTLSEVRVQLVFPADEESRRFFEESAGEQGVPPS